MDLLVLFLGTVVCIVGYFTNRLISKVDKVETDLQEHKITDLGKYATKMELNDAIDNFKGFMKEVMEPTNRKLESIEEHLRGGRRKS